MEEKAAFEGIKEYLTSKKFPKFCYTDLIDRGFEREDVNDSVHFDQYGYYDFFLLKTLSKKRGVYMYWNPQSREVKVYKEAANGEELCWKWLESLDEVDFFIELFDK